MLKLIKTISTTTVAMLNGAVRTGGTATAWLEESLNQARYKQVVLSRAEMDKEIKQGLIEYEQFLLSMSDQQRANIALLEEQLKNYKFID